MAAIIIVVGYFFGGGGDPFSEQDECAIACSQNHHNDETALRECMLTCTPGVPE